MRSMLWLLAVPAGIVGLSVLPGAGADDYSPEKIIALERAALDRWCKGDPGGYLETYAPEVTYFDPGQEKRVDGLQAMKDLLAPIAGKIRISRYDMLAPKVQRHGDAAVLTFNVVNYLKRPDGSEVAAARWNSTEVYGRVGGNWRIVHSHWSFVKPELKQPVPGP
jgi:ketosteroid isomerase-like protein